MRAFIRGVPPLRRGAIAAVRTTKRIATVTHLREVWVNARAALRLRGRPSGRFVVFGQGRSGSSLLLDLIGSHPEVYVEAEIFHRGAHSQLISPRRYLNARAALSPCPTYGCQLKIYQMTDDQGIEDPHRFMLDLHDEGWKVIYLIREDLFRKALSLVVAETRGQFLDRKSGGTGVDSIAIDPVRLEAAMRERRKADEDEVAALHGVPHTRVTYEEDLLDGADHQAMCDRVLEYLGLESARVETRFVRTSHGHVSDYISNYPEVHAHLNGTEFAAYLPAIQTT